MITVGVTELGQLVLVLPAQLLQLQAQRRGLRRRLLHLLQRVLQQRAEEVCQLHETPTLRWLIALPRFIRNYKNTSAMLHKHSYY